MVEAYILVRRQRVPDAGSWKEMKRCWEEKSDMVRLRVELVLNKHQMEPFDKGLLERKPSMPRGASKDEGGSTKVMGSARKIMFGDLKEIKW